MTGTRGELLRVATTEDAAAAAARMLELAGRNAEELVSDARSQADRIVAEASGRAEELDGDTEQRRAQLVADLERDHQELKDEVEDLRAFEREYRAQLRNYFQQQLEALDAQGGGVTLAEDLHEDEGEIGSRLRSILAEESEESERVRGRLDGRGRLRPDRVRLGHQRHAGRVLGGRRRQGVRRRVRRRHPADSLTQDDSSPDRGVSGHGDSDAHNHWAGGSSPTSGRSPRDPRRTSRRKLALPAGCNRREVPNSPGTR